MRRFWPSRELTRFCKGLANNTRLSGPLEQGEYPAPGARVEGKSIQTGIVGELAQIALDLPGQDQLQIFLRGVVDEVPNQFRILISFCIGDYYLEASISWIASMIR